MELHYTWLLTKWIVELSGKKEASSLWALCKNPFVLLCKRRCKYLSGSPSVCLMDSQMASQRKESLLLLSASTILSFFSVNHLLSFSYWMIKGGPNRQHYHVKGLLLRDRFRRLALDVKDGPMWMLWGWCWQHVKCWHKIKSGLVVTLHMYITYEVPLVL